MSSSADARPVVFVFTSLLTGGAPEIGEDAAPDTERDGGASGSHRCWMSQSDSSMAAAASDP